MTTRPALLLTWTEVDHPATCAGQLDPVAEAIRDEVRERVGRALPGAVVGTSGHAVLAMSRETLGVVLIAVEALTRMDVAEARAALERLVARE